MKIWPILSLLSVVLFWTLTMTMSKYPHSLIFPLFFCFLDVFRSSTRDQFFGLSAHSYFFKSKDGRQEPRGGHQNRTLTNPRWISQKNQPDGDIPDSRYTNMVMQFGQFLDHDVTLTPKDGRIYNLFKNIINLRNWSHNMIFWTLGSVLEPHF